MECILITCTDDNKNCCKSEAKPSYTSLLIRNKVSEFTWVTFRNDDHITFHDLCVCFYFFPFIRFRFTSSVNLFKALNNFLVRLFNRENVESVNRLYIPPVLCVCFFSITFNDDEKLHFALIFPFRFVCVSWRIFRVSRFGLPEESKIFPLLECFFFILLLLLFWSFEMFELSLLSVHDVQMKWRAIWNSCY